MMAYGWYQVIWVLEGSSYELKWSVTEMEWIREASSGGGVGGGDREMQGNGVHKWTEARQKNELMGIQV